MNRILYFFSVVILLGACSSGGNRNPDYLPASTGKPGDVVVIIDSTQWNGPVGRAMKDLFLVQAPGLPREEYLFNIINVHPSNKIELLRQVRNVIYVFTLDTNTPGVRAIARGFTAETLKEIRQDTSFYITWKKDMFSKGQEVMYLFGDTEANLIHHLHRDGHTLVDFFNRKERERLANKLFGSKTAKHVASFMRNEYQCELKVPNGYNLADKTPDFLWFRRVEPEVDKDIFVSWKNYESEYQLLPDSLIAWRDQIAEKYLFEDPENPATFLMTETEVPFIPVQARQMDMNGHFAMELRGLWRTNNKSMGGPFLSYTLVDQSKGLIYYIEGFTYSPGKDQREIMRELETILWSFKTSDELSLEKP